MNKIDDNELIAHLRADLDQMVGDAGRGTPPEVPLPSTMPSAPRSTSPRWLALGAAAATVAVLVGGLVVLTRGDTDDDVVATVPPADTTIPGTTPGTTPGTVAPTTPPSGEPAMYETLGTVIDDGTGARLCFSVMESLPPQCGAGMSLADWSWDAITVEQQGGDPGQPVTWVDSIYIRGAYETDTQRLHVAEARIPSDDERERLTGGPDLDLSVPCEPPADGWPAGNRDVVVPEIEGFSGSWYGINGDVFVVKVVGDLDAAYEALDAANEFPVCVAAATHTQAELADIQNQLLSMSSVQYTSVSTYVDASGEWVQADLAGPPNAELQASFDAEFGLGVVRLSSPLHPIENSPTSPQQLVEITSTVLDNGEGTQVVCVGEVLESFPVQCPNGAALSGWSWDLISGEQVVGTVTFGDAYMTGYHDESTNTFTVVSARDAVETDGSRLMFTPIDG